MCTAVLVTTGVALHVRCVHTQGRCAVCWHCLCKVLITNVLVTRQSITIIPAIHSSAAWDSSSCCITSKEQLIRRCNSGPNKKNSGCRPALTFHAYDRAVLCCVCCAVLCLFFSCACPGCRCGWVGRVWREPSRILPHADACGVCLHRRGRRTSSVIP